MNSLEQAFTAPNTITETIRGVKLTVAPADHYMNRDYGRVMIEAADLVASMKKAKESDAAIDQRVDVKVTAEALLVDWDATDSKGKPIPCTPAYKVAMLEKMPGLLSTVRRLAKPDNFFSYEHEEDAAKN